MKFKKIYLMAVFLSAFFLLFFEAGASAQWITKTLDETGSYFWGDGDTSIAVDSNDKVHISYYDATNEDLKYVTNASSAIVISTIDSDGGAYLSMAIDSNDKLHIAYVDTTPSNDILKYATNASGNWVITTIDSIGLTYPGVYTNTGIALDLNNKVHISYYNAADKDLKYATNAGGGWVTATVDSTGDTGIYNSIAV
ncbi:MAG: hypothetical protein HY806_07185, partial [Nitrospirae bacterium]|nr:hypothetical protein [Nitrospirota bacterium]